MTTWCARLSGVVVAASAASLATPASPAATGLIASWEKMQPPPMQPNLLLAGGDRASPVPIQLLHDRHRREQRRGDHAIADRDFGKSYFLP